MTKRRKALCLVTLAFALGLGLMAPAPVAAQAAGIADLAGRWRGEGQLVLDAEPPRRFRCQIRLRPVDSARTIFSGRCATAQGGRTFNYLLAIDAGAVQAENRSDPPDDLPAQMQGRLADGVLRFAGEGGALFELGPHPEGLSFRLEGEGPQGFARGAVLLRRPAVAE